DPPETVLAINEALDRLTARDPFKAKVVKMRYLTLNGLVVPKEKTMLATHKAHHLGVVLATGIAALASVLAADASDVQRDLAQVKGAVAQLHRAEAAQAAGWDLVPGLDHCFESEAGGMGFHYINLGLLDTTVDPLHPEALVYHHLPNGTLRLGAVEYIVPAAAWDSEGHGELPMLFGQHFHLNEALGVYVLHAWIFTHNPAGMFEDWNPLVSCSNE
ncbi:MAG: hypothetical protein L0Z50_31920, partial [Verrucomicrobiales bacterium]|nr:hypothetical protein [Verrucomicrobiales bacterium]